MKYVKTFRVLINDTDCNGVAKASTVMKYYQQIAHEQLQQVGPDSETLKKSGCGFVLSRVSLSIYLPLFADDEITAETWPCESRGTSFIRCGRIMRGEDIVSEIYTVWGLVGMYDKKLRTVDEYPVGAPPEPALTLDIPTRLRLPKNMELMLAGERKIVYSDVDTNMHMNNAHYPDMFCDFVPSHGGKNRLVSNRPVAVLINYFSEAPLGETLKIYSGEEDGNYFFKTIRENGTVGAEAEIILDEI